MTQPAADQGAAADDLGGAARRRPAQGPLASPRRIDGEAHEASGELPAALALEHRPGMLERMPRRTSVRVSQLRESPSPPWKSRLIAVCAVLAVEPCVPRSAALRLRSALNGSVSPVPAGSACTCRRHRGRRGRRSPPRGGWPRRPVAAVLLGESRDERGRRGDELGAIRFSIVVELPLRVSHRANSSRSCS